jgi:hypothetical protein
MRADQIIVVKNFITEEIGASKIWGHSTRLSERTHITDGEGRELKMFIYECQRPNLLQLCILDSDRFAKSYNKPVNFSCTAMAQIIKFGQSSKSYDKPVNTAIGG